MRMQHDPIAITTPRRDALLRDGLLILAGSMLVAIGAKIQIPGPIPTTMQTFAVLLIGATLGSRRGALVLVAYLLEGAAGLPVFAGLAAGPAYFAGPTMGYLLGFVLAAYVVGRMVERRRKARLFGSVGIFMAGHALILACGFAWMAVPAGPTVAWVTGVAPFAAGAVLKSLLAAAALPTSRRFVRRF
ncbi:MAG: biotin transporter BioY [Phycisphaerae bacterium]